MANTHFLSLSRENSREKILGVIFNGFLNGLPLRTTLGAHKVLNDTLYPLCLSKNVIGLISILKTVIGHTLQYDIHHCLYALRHKPKAFCILRDNMWSIWNELNIIVIFTQLYTYILNGMRENNRLIFLPLTLYLHEGTPTMFSM